MNSKYDTVPERSLRAALSEEKYLLHQAALEWSLADPIIIQSSEDIQSRVNWRDRLEPFDHQVKNLFTFCRRLPVTLLADDVGLGKTISAGLILSELMTRRRVSRTLVLCPKILCPQWVDELDAKFGIEGRVAVGQELNEELTRKIPVIVTTYETARDRLSDVKPNAFDMLILDEAHKLKNLHGGDKPPPKLATAVRSALEKRLFKYVVMLTATPIHNRLWDVYSLIDCLTVAKGHKNPLGTPDEFNRLYLLQGTNERGLHPLRAEKFRSILRQYIVRTRRGDTRLKFPTREVLLSRVRLSRQEEELTRLVGCHIGALNGLEQTSLAQALMSSPAALAAQLEKMKERLPAAAREARALADSCGEPAKLQRLLFICNELKARRPADWRVVVFTLRLETLKLIGQALARQGIPVGYIQGGQFRQNQLAIERIQQDPPSVHVLISTDAGAEGINLQKANVLVNYDLPWNPMVVEQRIGRIQRLASEHEYVVIYNLVAAGSVEERVVGRLMEKLQTIAHALGDIDSILESPKWDGDEDGFENQIRQLVVKSLQGQDMKKATELQLESIERAWAQVEKGRTELDQTLGTLDELHHAGPQMPKLARVLPGMSDHDFVLRAWRADGWTVVERSPGAYNATKPGRPPEVLAFDEKVAEAFSNKSVFMGNVKLYQPGKTEFERLVQHWWTAAAITSTTCDVTRRPTQSGWPNPGARRSPRPVSSAARSRSTSRCSKGRLASGSRRPTGWTATRN